MVAGAGADEFEERLLERGDSPRTSASVPCARMRPAAMTATQSQRDSTSSITWEEKTTVAPEAV